MPAVLEPEQVVAVLRPATGGLVGLARQQRRQVDLLRADGVHLLPDDLLDPAQHLQPQRQPGVHPRGHASDVAGADEQLVARHLRVGRVLAQGPEEQRRHPGQHPEQSNHRSRPTSPRFSRRRYARVRRDHARAQGRAQGRSGARRRDGRAASSETRSTSRNTPASSCASCVPRPRSRTRGPRKDRCPGTPDAPEHASRFRNVDHREHRPRSATRWASAHRPAQAPPLLHIAARPVPHTPPTLCDRQPALRGAAPHATNRRRATQPRAVGRHADSGTGVRAAAAAHPERATVISARERAARPATAPGSRTPIIGRAPRPTAARAARPAGRRRCRPRSGSRRGRGGSR